MSRRMLLIILGAVLLVLLVLLGIWVMQKNKTPTPTTNVNVNTVVPNVNTVNTNTAVNLNVNKKPVDVDANEKNTVKSMGKNFASIYGSFSTQNDYRNITDLYFYMAPALRSQQEQYVATERAKNNDTSLYHGISSEARIVKLDNFDSKAGAASVTVTLYRIEYTGSTSNSSSYVQDITLGFEKVDGSWKVAKINWGQKQ
jgi:hypothetical protein